MTHLTVEQIEKIRILDKLLDSLTVDDLRLLSESNQIVSKLKGHNTNSSLLENLVNNNIQNSNNIISLTAEISSLKNDIQSLIKALNTSLYGYNQEFNNLKQKHYIY